ncbi:antibiotic biosynthesis monooxygenase [Mangrovivirga sp. M17]|uniref:Antibiotic biosynthesis monooxygenase n=1 Tax=Mangrovivirga halotolerans TaxID=2993936 RepID=A0ABT3RP52_9BACT|nr:antibiotic biosynthesis monooxygenase family protein [Mangrovivirga halotolerans]MCX2743567.1 antibiotic biosynthesis monooxygenase [Mangrovivirga halotolerans]
MLIRIVRMSFEPSKTEEFIEIFKNSQKKIQAFEGCEHVELMQDLEHPNVFSTYSIWESDLHLQKYRHSELFKSTWAKTKILFNGKPEAHSYKKKIE